MPKYCQERAGLPGVPLSIGKTTTSAQIPGPRWTPHRAIRTQESRNSQGQDPLGRLLHTRADPVPQLSIPKFLPEKTGLPGVVAHRLAGGQTTVRDSKTS